MDEHAKFCVLVASAAQRARRAMQWPEEFPAQGSMAEVSFVAALSLAYAGDSEHAEKFQFKVFAALDTLRHAAREGRGTGTVN